MKLIKQTRMQMVKGRITKIYIVDLCELAGFNPERFVVNFRYGNQGKKLWEGSKTSVGVTLEEATDIFNSIVVAKCNKGFQVEGDTIENSPTTTGSHHEIPPEESRPHTTRTPKELIVYYLYHPPTHWALSRIIWRAGELKLKDAVEPLIALQGHGTWMENYAIAWSLGRINDPRGLDTLDKLRKHNNSVIQRIAREAYCTLASPEQRGSYLSDVKEDLSKKISTLIDQNNPVALAEKLLNTTAISGLIKISTIEKIYLLALENQCCHQAIQILIPQIPIKHNSFKFLRYLYKMAEFRFDGVILGIIIGLFEKNRPRSRRPYSKHTATYLAKRNWHTLTKLGDQKDHRYLDLALGVLTAITPDDQQGSYNTSRYLKNPNTQRYERIQGSYGPFSHFKTAGHILYHKSDAHIYDPSDQRFFNIKGKKTSHTSGAYDQLWQQHPRYLIELLIKGTIEPVHQFGIGNLKECITYLRTVPTETLLPLLQTPVKITADFILEILNTRYSDLPREENLMIALIHSPWKQLQKLAHNWIEQSPEILTQNLNLLVTVLISNQITHLKWLSYILPKLYLTHIDQRTVFTNLLQKILAQTLSIEFVDKLSPLLIQNFENPFSDHPFQQIIPLLKHTEHPIQILGASLLKHPAIALDQLPIDLIETLINHDHELLQREGISLLLKLSDHILVGQKELLIQFATSSTPPLREAVLPVIKRLINYNNNLKDYFLDPLLAPLFQKESSEGAHNDLIHLITTTLITPQQQPDHKLVWRLLRAKSKGANNLGALLLNQVPETLFSVKQWGRLGNSAVYAVRQWVQKCYRDHIDMIQHNPEDALLILHTKWGDTKEFAINFFGQHFAQSEWTPELLISICDHTDDQIQQFGRELITRFFNQGDGKYYLTKLSQHPTHNMQLFVTHFLQEYAAEDHDRIHALKAYFITVLSALNRGRIARDRVIQFLLKEALKSRDIARFTLELFNRQSLTGVVADRTAYLLGMRDIFMKFPDLNTPITLKKAPIRGYQPEVLDGV